MSNPSDQLSVDYDQVHQSTQNLSASSGAAQSTHSTVDTVVGYQTSQKWGTQPGPTTFQSQYSGTLADLQGQIATVRANIDGLNDGVTKVASSSDDTDSQAATAIKNITNGVAAIESAAPVPGNTTPDSEQVQQTINENTLIQGVINSDGASTGATDALTTTSASQPAGGSM